MVIVLGIVDGGRMVMEEDSWCQIGWVIFSFSILAVTHSDTSNGTEFCSDTKL